MLVNMIPGICGIFSRRFLASAPVAVKSPSAWIGGGETKLGRVGPRRPMADLRPAAPAQRRPGGVDRLIPPAGPRQAATRNKPHSAAVILI